MTQSPRRIEETSQSRLEASMLGDDAATAPAGVGACALRTRAERYPRGLVEHLVHPTIVLRAAFCAFEGSIRGPLIRTDDGGVPR